MPFLTLSRVSARRKTAATGAVVVLGAAGLLLQAAPAQASSGGAQAIAHRMIPNKAQFRCFSHIVAHESSWNVHAVNQSSGAYGLVQALPASKMASAGANWRNSASTQIKWGLNYMKGRYGSPCGAWAFWQVNHWY